MSGDYMTRMPYHSKDFQGNATTERMARKVLLIEYEARSAERVRGLLTAPGFTVVEAHDGEEGLAAFTSSRFDLVVLSGMLPRLPSAEVIREIRRKGGATAPPILLMVSGYKGTNKKADAQRVGAFDILVKPFEDSAFQEAVQQAIESTNVRARTMKISTAEVPPASRLTSEDIFSDVLEDVGGEAVRPVAQVAPPKPILSAADEVEKRLRDTLSGILDHRTPPRGTIASAATLDKTPPPAAPAAAAPPHSPRQPRYSTDEDIDRMIHDTLSGLRVPQKRRPASADAPAGKPAFADIASGKPAEPADAARRPEPLAGPAALVTAPSPVSGPDPDRFGQYQIIEKIASGGMADVYKARRSGVEGFQKILAIKKILPHLADNEEFITMFADEAKLAAHLSHPNIVHIHDLGKIDAGGYFIAMELVDGRDLRAILQTAREVSTPMPVPLAIYVASKVASALDYAHRRRDANSQELSIVHRDVSPQNILISYEGDIKLCDFGIAKAVSKASTTQSGALKGKVQYMSPEQAWGRPIDRRSDIFSLGSVLFEILTGEKLFRGDSDLNLLEKVRAADVPAASSLNPEVPKSLDTILAKTLAREPDDRYANASELLRDLESVLYSYTPAPGSADLAIFLHRLQAEEAAAAEARARDATPVATAEPPKKRRSKGTPIARRPTGSAPKFVEDLAASSAEASETPPGRLAASPTETIKPFPPPSGVYGVPPAARMQAEKKSRTALFAAIGVAVAALAVGAWWITSRPAAPSKAAISAAATPLPVLTPGAGAPMVVPAGLAVPTPAVTSVPAGYDPKAVEAEVQRQLAAKKKELQKTLEPSAPGGKAARESVAAPAVHGKEEPTPAAEAPATKSDPEPAAEPTAVATRAPLPTEAPARPAPVKDSEVSRGDLVGPGPGVVEPALIAPPRVSYPPLARRQRVSGRVIVLVLVDENGNVSDARLQQGVLSKLGVNEAVLEAVRKSRFRSATKSGVPVKMWRTVVVDVQP